MHPLSTSSQPPIPATTFSDIPDVLLRDHILTLLDGPTLASLSCVSTHFRSLIDSPSSLWSHICGTTWPSTLHPLLRHVIPSFPTRNPLLSFFSQSYTVLASDPGRLRPSRSARRLISALDLRYRGDIVFSRAVETETSSGWFLHSPFRIDLLEPKEAVPTPIPSLDSPDTCQELGDDLTLSWIVVDPDGKRAANLSSHKAVSVERHWLSGEVQARFSSVLGGEKGTAREYVEFLVTVTLGGSTSTCGGYTEVRELSVRAEDMEGNSLKGKESLRILEAGGFGGTKCGGTRRESAARTRYEEFLRRKEERKEMKARKEGRLDRCLCIGFGLAAAVLALWSFSLFNTNT